MMLSVANFNEALRVPQVRTFLFLSSFFFLCTFLLQGFILVCVSVCVCVNVFWGGPAYLAGMLP
jgi:hypothetical protein